MHADSALASDKEGSELNSSLSTSRPIPVQVDKCLLDGQPEELLTLFRLYNQSRDRGEICGNGKRRTAPALAWNCSLAKAAKKHAKDMSGNDFLSHRGSDGSDIGLRASRDGYQWTYISENVAKGHESANGVYRNWLGSSAHCSNIMSQNYTEIGAAKESLYWVVMLGQQ